MAETRDSQVVSAVQLLAVVCLISLFTQGVRAGTGDPAQGPVTCRYVFLSGQSTVTQTGGFAGVHEVYPIKGSFVLTVDLNAGTASFDVVDAGVTRDTSFLPTGDLDGLFNMTALAGTVVDEATFEFRGKTEDEVYDVSFRLVLDDDIAHLTGETIAPPNSADMFVFRLEAMARRKYARGTGAPDDPYLIYTAAQMNAIGADPNDWDKHFKLMADIDLAELGDTQFNIIGTDPNHPFKGIVDGNGHAISNFVYTAKARYVGLFGVVADPNAEIRNLRLIAPRVRGPASYVGSLVAYLRQGALLNCHAEDVDIECHAYYTGGLVGMSGTLSRYMTATFRNCSATGRISGSLGSVATGGLVGRDGIGSFYDCFATCEVSGWGGAIGGLAGYAEGTLFINCYASGNVTGGPTTIVGGLIGSSPHGAIANCYSASRISGTWPIGGLIGSTGGMIVSMCVWDAEISDRLDRAGSTGRTTAEMHDPNTFIAMGWDFVGASDGPSDIWAEPPGGGYPILWWQLAEPPKLPFSDGTGSPDDPYLIATAEQLNSIGYNPRLMSAHFRLVNNIDLSGVHFYPIGTDKYPYPYTGVFDGGGFTITNFSYATSEAASAGLFRAIQGREAGVRDLTLIDPVVEATQGVRVGSLAGVVEQGTLRNCHVNGGHISGHTNVGGLVGATSNWDLANGCVWPQLQGCSASTNVTGYRTVGGLVGTNDRRGLVADCCAQSNVTGQFFVGGLVGVNSAAGILNCNSAGLVTGELQVGGLVGQSGLVNGVTTRSFSTASVNGDTLVGGLAGVNFGLIADCYSTGDVTGDEKVGGLAGSNVLTSTHAQIPGTISRCYAAGSVSGNRDVEGLVGDQALGSISACFWDVETSGLPVRTVGAAKTTAEMQMASTFLDAGWDFVGEVENGTEDIWWIDEGKDYPRLTWEQVE